MRCEKCQEEIPTGEEREHYGRLLCEECYMDALSPPRGCDPWAVHTAKSFSKQGKAEPQINDAQKGILRILEETGGVSRAVLAERLQMNPSALERELAALRHMEKIRGKLENGQKIIVLW
jgi:hypothetical protein